MNTLNTYHHHECRNPGGSPNVMFFSHLICYRNKKRENYQGIYSNPLQIYILQVPEILKNHPLLTKCVYLGSTIIMATTHNHYGYYP